jgi:putative DNA primase/helicase
MRATPQREQPTHAPNPLTPPKPETSAIPHAMLQERRWVCWRYAQRDGKWTKVPCQPDGRPAKSDDPATWTTWERTSDAANRYGAVGVGFMLGGGWIGIDLDRCRDPQTGTIEPWAQAIVDRLRSYAEASPSGTGVHVLCRGTLPPGRRRKGQIEVYDSGRFFTITGARLNQFGVEDRTAELAALHAEVFGQNGRQARTEAPGGNAGAGVELDDQELTRKACEAKDGGKFARLWAGQWQGEYASQSEADLALCSLLAFWTAGDAGRIDRLFRQSGLMREKWDRADYREATIGRALEGATEFYRPSRRTNGRCDAPTAKTSTGFETSNDAVIDDRFVRLPLTDSGNAERLVLRHGANIRYCHPQNTWWLWTGKRWETDRTGHVMELAKAVARELYQAAWDIPDAERKKQTALWAIRSESTDKKRATLASAQSEPGIPVLPEQFDADPWVLNCVNGVVDLRTGELRPHCREDYCTRMAPVRYDPAARSELWERFLEEACGGDRQLIEFLQRAVGYSLTGSTAEEKLFFVHGPAASGKSSFLEAIRSVLGDYAKAADFESFIQRRDAGAIRNDIAELAGRRFVVSIEVDEGRRLAEGLVKLLTGGDTVRARFLYQESFEFTPQFKLWLAANHAPRVRHDDSAMWRRILRVPFEHVIPPERRDPSVKARLKDVQESGSAIVAWAVEGCLRWQEEGLGIPDVVKEATEQLRLDMDPLRGFIEDCCVLRPDAWMAAAKLREAYERYCQENGEKRLLSPNDFAEGLRARGCEAERRGKDRTRGWRGIGLLVNEEGSGNAL